MSTPIEQNLSEINFDELLEMTYDIDQSKRNKSMITINNIAESNFSFFLKKLGNILSNESKPVGIRQSAAILIKNSLIHTEKFQEFWKTKLNKEDKNQIKLYVLSTLASTKKEIRTIVSTLISSICKIDQPITKTWPDLLPSLTQNAFNENINMKLAAIETLGYVCEELTLKNIGSNSVDIIMNSLIQNLINEKNSCEVIIQVLKALYDSISLAEKNFSKKNECAIIMNAIFQIGQKYENNENILDKIAMLFIKMFSISNYYDYICDFFKNIAQFSFHIINNYKESNERLALLGLEILLSIGDEEKNRISPLDISLSQLSGNFNIENKKKISKGYYNLISNDLQKLIVDNVEVPEDDEDENEWNISNACLSILNLLVELTDIESIGKFFNELSNQINNSKNKENDRAKCWLLLGSSLNIKYKTVMSNLLMMCLKTILEDIEQNNSSKLKRCASFLIEKITNIFPKLFDGSKLNNIINVLSTNIKNNTDTFIIMNLCQSLQNLIKVFGDFKTNKSSCTLSPYFDKIFNGLFNSANIEIMNSKESTKCSLRRLMTIGTLIDYSSHDKQIQINQIILQFLREIESTQNSIEKLISSGVSKETIFQIQEFYYSLLQKLFNKYKSKINYDLAKNIWILTENLFKYRQTVFDEANMALAALARNMEKNFTPIFINYYPYIEFSIKSYNNNSLSKSGLLSLYTCITSTQDSIEKSSDMIKILMDVCTSNDVVRNNKCIAISCIGQLILFTGNKFEKYLEMVMKLLFSAAQMGINISPDFDEDIIEFVKNLRYELIQTFTCIELTFNDNEKILAPYMRDIVSFLKFCVNDVNIQRSDILKSTLGLLIDFFDLYGQNFKELCDQNFAGKLIELLQKKNEIHDADVEQNIDLLKSYFI